MSQAKHNKIIVSVIGAGYVGLTTAVLLAESGYEVFLIDIDKHRLDTIASGKSFFYEEGIDPLIRHSVENKLLHPTDSYHDSIPKSSFVFSCVGTPDNPDGSSNLSYVFSAAQQAANLMKPGTIFIQKSTVPVGTGKRVIEDCDFDKKQIAYISNPEFLREGTAISDTLWFDRIVVGGAHPAAISRVVDLYKTIEQHRVDITSRAGLTKGSNEAGQYITTNQNSAELIKVTSNAFLALKISFANSIAKLADHTDADVTEVMNAVGADARIGRAFLNAGRGYGGGCFPKDVSGLISSATEHGVDMPIMIAASEVNETMPGYIATKVQEKLGGLEGKCVAVLGLAFKAGTSDVRRSQSIKLANILAKSGAHVSAYDPQANAEAKENLQKNIVLYESITEAINECDAVCIATDWPELITINPIDLKKQMKGSLVMDCMNMLDSDKITKAGLTYIGVGRKS